MSEHGHDDHDGSWSKPDWDADTASSEADASWPEPQEPRPLRSARSVMLLARLVGVLAVAFAVVAAVVVHASGSSRLAGDVTSARRTVQTPSPTPSAKPAESHLNPVGRGKSPGHHVGGLPGPRHLRPTPAASKPAGKPTSSKVEVDGQITCLSGRSVEGVWVQARVHSGFAPWIPLKLPGKTLGSTSKWWYWLPKAESYSLHIGCGGTKANWGVACYSKVVPGVPMSFGCIDTKSKAGYGTCYAT